MSSYTAIMQCSDVLRRKYYYPGYAPASLNRGALKQGIKLLPLPILKRINFGGKGYPLSRGLAKEEPDY